MILNVLQNPSGFKGGTGLNRGLLNLGPGGTMTLTVSKPMLTVDLVGTLGQMDASTAWKRSFDLVLPNAAVGP